MGHFIPISGNTSCLLTEILRATLKGGDEGTDKQAVWYIPVCHRHDKLQVSSLLQEFLTTNKKHNTGSIHAWITLTMQDKNSSTRTRSCYQNIIYTVQFTSLQAEKEKKNKPVKDCIAVHKKLSKPTY